MRPRRLDHLRKLIGLVTIRTKEMDVAPIDLDGEFAWAQKQVVEEVIRQYNLGLPVRIIVCKARQLGLSTISAAIMFNWLFMFPGASELVIAHDRETTESLFEKMQDAWGWWPFKDILHLRHASARRLTIEETGSTVRIATAKNEKSGRGRTHQALHASEMSFWDDPETLMRGLSKTVPNLPGTIVIIECTSNGVGNLYWQMWQDAMAGRSDYKALFFPWWKHPEYRMVNTTLNYIDLNEYERWLFDDLGVSLDRIEWYRWAIINECHGDPEEMQQEYPSTAEESFLKTGRNVFRLDKLAKCFKPKLGARGYLHPRPHGQYEFVRDPLGPLTIYSWPSKDRKWGDYFIGGDPSRTAIGDPACAQVINRRTFEQVAVWHGQIDPVNFADQLRYLGYYYNTALLSSEIEGPGYATIGALLKANYPRIWQHRWADKHPGKLATNFGWSTNFQRKNWMMGTVRKLIGDGSLEIHDEQTYNQMRDFVVIDRFGEMGPSDKQKGHDDAVMAYAQAVHCSIWEADPSAWSEGIGPQSKHAPESTDIGGVPPWEAFDMGEDAEMV
jgi:hypothetical protein